MSLASDDVAALIASIRPETSPILSILSNSPSAVTVTQDAEPSGTARRGGRLASRLVQDWFAGRLQDANPDGPPTECPALRVFPLRPEAGSDHDLVIIPSQSYDAAHDPESRGRSLLSCMCRYCRYHFVFQITPGAQEDRSAHLQHHFREGPASWYKVTEVDMSPSFKLSPTKGRIQYSCTLCSMNIVLEITLPRLKPAWIQMIMDEDRIRDSLRAAKEEDPERYADTTPAKETHYVTTPLSTLNQYLKNILDDDGKGPGKRISCRNKTFLVQFGRACDHIFRYLAFQDEYDETTRDSYWVPPRLSPQEGKTPLGSERAFFEDVRSEVQSLLDDKPPINGQPVVKPISAREPLQKALGCDKPSRGAGTLAVDSSEAQHFRTLGAPTDADDTLLRFAYDKQVEADPDHVSDYLSALANLSVHRGMDLVTFVLSQQDMLAKKADGQHAVPPATDPTGKAYAHFNLPRDSPEDPKHFIGVYKTYREQAPAQKCDHRLAMLQIGKDRDSKEIFDVVYGTPMELQEACQLLGVEPEWPMDNIAAVAQSITSDVDPGLVVMALETISLNRPADDPNRGAFESILGELRSSREPQHFSANTATGLPTPSPSPVATHDAPERYRESVDLDLPVGLANLRNTCYLNSILQYFYSVNAVRDLTLNSDLPVLEPTEAHMSNLLRRAGGQAQPELETGRAFVGHEFTRELSNLFRELDASGERSVSPRQRLANAALLRPEKLRPRLIDSKTPASPDSTDAPPLPPRTSESSSPMTVVTQVSMEADSSDTTSCDSAQTLVGDASLTTTTTGDQHAEKETATGGDHGAEKGAPAAQDGPAKQSPPSAAAGGTTEGETKMSKRTVEELAEELDKPNVGSDQMDVDEVMGNAIDHLRAAFKVAQIGRSDAAPDPIEQAFFSTFIDNRKKIGEPDWNRTSRSDRWVTAYPAQSGTRDLYDALANSFDLEPIPGDLLSFTTIERPAPHFHICIQRSDGIRKNSNPIIIPETLYLDRFMHTADNQSSLFKTRKRKWDVQTRLNETESADGGFTGAANTVPNTHGPHPKPSAPGDNLFDTEIDGFLVVGDANPLRAQDPSSSATDTAGSGPDASGTALDPEVKQLMARYGVAEPQIAQARAKKLRGEHHGATSLPQSDLDEFWEKFVREESAERDRLTAERDRIFSDCRDVAYRLHAVVCHAGITASAGHYWVWIHDFERDVWRKYNDTTVSVHPAEYVFQELHTKGEPYYLAYVRADDVHNLVSIPRRRQPALALTPPPVPPRPSPAEDMAMSDVADSAKIAVEHVEDVDMLPPPPYSA